jgi:hypothetical protein
MIGVFYGAGFCRALVGGEGVVPETVEVGTEGFDTSRIQLVQAAVSMGPIDHQVRVLQNPQMLRDRRTADRKSASELTHRLRSLEQPFQDGSPGRIA